MKDYIAHTIESLIFLLRSMKVEYKNKIVLYITCATAYLSMIYILFMNTKCRLRMLYGERKKKYDLCQF